MSISVNYTLAGNGWAECLINIDDQTIHLHASYLSDALADLLESVTLVVQGVEESTASFAAEPGEYRWRFKRVAPDRIHISIIWFTELWKHRSDTAGTVILDTECRLRTFAGAILSASQRVLSTHDLDGYRQNWVNYEFPITAQAKLKAALATQRKKCFPVSE